MWLWLLASAPSALANNNEDYPNLNATVGVSLDLGALGKSRMAFTSDFVGTVSGQSPMAATLGFGLRARKPLDEYFSLGAHLVFSRWRTVESDGSSSLLDLGARPEARYVLAQDVEVYGVIPLGFTLSHLPQKTWSDRDSSLGVHLGAVAGIRARATDDLIGFAEVGYLSRSARHDFGAVEVRLRLHEPVLRVGVAIEL